jgi:predicted amidohydrolase YtcJ
VLDLLTRGARIRTVDPRRPAAAAIGIWNGLIIGLDEDLGQLPARAELDADGAVIVPSGVVRAPAERTTAADALAAAYTTGAARAARAARAEQHRGSLAPRMAADLVLLADDPVTMPQAAETGQAAHA